MADNSQPRPWSIGEYDRVQDATGKTIRLTGFSLATAYVPPDDEAYTNMRLIFAAVNAHESLQQECERLREALRLAIRNEESRLYMLPASDDFAVSAQKDILSAAIGHYRAALAPRKGAADGKQTG